MPQALCVQKGGRVIHRLLGAKQYDPPLILRPFTLTHGLIDTVWCLEQRRVIIQQALEARMARKDVDNIGCIEIALDVLQQTHGAKVEIDQHHALPHDLGCSGQG